MPTKKANANPFRIRTCATVPRVWTAVARPDIVGCGHAASLGQHEETLPTCLAQKALGPSSGVKINRADYKRCS